MKLNARQIDGFLKQPDPKIRVVLLYGPDEGLIRERCKILAKQICEDLSDPFNVAQFSGSDLNDTPAKLQDEAGAISMMGGDRVIIIEVATDKNTKTIKDYLENPSAQNLVLVQGGDLTPRSSLRSLFEKHDQAAALPCYVAEGQNLTRNIQDILREQEYRIDPDALQYLAANLLGDHAQMRSELDKLITYMGTEKNITLLDAMNNTGNLSEQRLDELVYNCLSGNVSMAESLLNGLLSEGTSGVYILRSIQNHLRKLLKVQIAIENGSDQRSAVKSLRPPIFFKYESRFMGQLSKWSRPKILKVLKKINELEMDLKKTGTPEALTLARSLFGLAQMAR